VLKITKSYTYHFIYVFPHHYEYLCDSTTLDEDAVGAHLGDRSRFDTSNL
jgi:hypothetical protein